MIIEEYIYIFTARNDIILISNIVIQQVWDVSLMLCYSTPVAANDIIRL